jgi:hypothetical protein
MPRFNQDSQSDVSIKQRLVKLLKEDAKKFTPTLKVQGVSEGNAKIFDELEKSLNNYKILLEEFLSAQDSSDVFDSDFARKADNDYPLRYLKELLSKVKRFGFDVIKSIRSVRSKDLTLGEIEEISIYISDFEKMKETTTIYYEAFKGSYTSPQLVEIFSNIIDTTNSIINQYQILRNKTDLPRGTVFEPEPLSGAGYYPKRFH